ncbi:MAG: carbohydrate binding family 9 domain-containing protein [Melioribacteraceae bacterium]|nr:carbohydrate binding family 9 domain-containing protein [Melioribacteraceae bacterium]
MKKIKYPLIILTVLLSTTLLANKPINKKVKAHRLETPIVIDGILDEPLYDQTPIDDFTQKEPDEGEPASERTHVWVGYDNEFIYFSAKLFDSEPELIDRALMRRDNWSNTDRFIIGIDTFFDKRTGFGFAVNAGGSMGDATISNDTWFDDSWDGIWDSEVSIDEEGWNVEIKIPFSQLRFNELDDMKWGINFERDIKRKNEESYYVMVPKDENGYASKMATLVGLEGIKMKQRIELLPYVVQKVQFLKHDDNDPFYSINQFKTSIGADFKIGIGSNLNLDATIFPDFGQVEVDPAVVNLSAFETFYQEKRPFFIEGASIFDFGQGGANNNWGFNFGTPELFYTRRIGRSPQVWPNSAYDYIDRPGETRILGAAKLSGKIDETWSIGAVSSFTERTYATLQLDGTQFDVRRTLREEIEPFTHYGVFRTQKQFNDSKQGLGVIFTSVNRDVSNSNIKSKLVNQAYTFGTDGWIFLDEDETYVITGSAVGSYTSGSKDAIEIKQRQSYRYAQRPDATTALLDTNLTFLSGWYSRVMLNKQKGNFYINAALGAVSPGFEYNDLGFQWNANKINGHLVLGYKWYDPDKIFRKKYLYLAHSQSFDFEGDNISNFLMNFIRMEFLNYYNIGWRFGYSFEAISVSRTRGGPKTLSPAGFFVGTNISSDRRKPVIVEFSINYNQNEIGGTGYGFEFEFEWKPLPQLNLSIEPGYNYNNSFIQWVARKEDYKAVNTFGTRYVFAEMKQQSISADIRLDWIFTPQISLQLFIQPLISVGKYSHFKELAVPRTLDYNYYGENGSTITYDSENSEYTVDPDGSGKSNFTFYNPDFNFKSFRANMVFRYEVLPGSILYFVWTNDRVNYENQGNFNVTNDFINLWETDTDNVFLLKFTYWIDM